VTPNDDGHVSHDGRYECRYCGTVLDVPAGRELHVTICVRSGRSKERIVTVDGVEVHHCCDETHDLPRRV
jgi:hypothetical protein